MNEVVLLFRQLSNGIGDIVEVLSTRLSGAPSFYPILMFTSVDMA